MFDGLGLFGLIPEDESDKHDKHVVVDDDDDDDDHHHKHHLNILKQVQTKRKHVFFRGFNWDATRVSMSWRYMMLPLLLLVSTP